MLKSPKKMLWGGGGVKGLETTIGGKERLAECGFGLIMKWKISKSWRKRKEIMKMMKIIVLMEGMREGRD